MKSLGCSCSPLGVLEYNRNTDFPCGYFSFKDQQVGQWEDCIFYLRIWMFDSLLVQTIEVTAVQVCNGHEVMCCFYEWLPSLLCQRCDCHKLTDGELPPSLSGCLFFLSGAFLTLSDVFVFDLLLSVIYHLSIKTTFWFPVFFFVIVICSLRYLFTTHLIFSADFLHTTFPLAVSSEKGLHIYNFWFHLLFHPWFFFYGHNTRSYLLLHQFFFSHEYAKCWESDQIKFISTV